MTDEKLPRLTSKPLGLVLCTVSSQYMRRTEGVLGGMPRQVLPTPSRIHVPNVTGMQVIRAPASHPPSFRVRETVAAPHHRDTSVYPPPTEPEWVGRRPRPLPGGNTSRCAPRGGRKAPTPSPYLPAKSQDCVAFHCGALPWARGTTSDGRSSEEMVNVFLRLRS